MVRTEINLEDLALRMSALDERAYGEFAEHFSPRFRALFVKRGLPIADAEEIAFSCVTDIALKIGMYHPANGHGFEAWVFTLARRSLMDWWRTRQPTEPVSESHILYLSAEDEVETDTSFISAVSEALAQLSEADRAIIEAVGFCGQTVAEAGATMRLSEQEARVHYHRALKRLQSKLSAR